MNINTIILPAELFLIFIRRKVSKIRIWLERKMKLFNICQYIMNNSLFHFDCVEKQNTYCSRGKSSGGFKSEICVMAQILTGGHSQGPTNE